MVATIAICWTKRRLRWHSQMYNSVHYVMFIFLPHFLFFRFLLFFCH